MRRFPCIVLAGGCFACSAEPGPDQLDKRFPDPVEIVKDASGPRQQSSGIRSASARNFAEFECALGAPVATRGLDSEVSTRIEGGETVTVTYYEPTGVEVFGLEARALERFRSEGGREGVATYVAQSRDRIVQAIQARYADAATDAASVRSPSMAGPIRIEGASGGLTRIVCNPTNGGGSF